MLKKELIYKQRKDLVQSVSVSFCHVMLTPVY
jgi:hypothetical protein